eukprot:scaffold24592_cov63-Phaeocystis_antarctica.AAC.2
MFTSLFIGEDRTLSSEQSSENSDHARPRRAPGPACGGRRSPAALCGLPLFILVTFKCATRNATTLVPAHLIVFLACSHVPERRGAPITADSPRHTCRRMVGRDRASSKILLTPQSSRKRCEATAQSALGWYRPSVGVPETFGGYRSSGVLRLTIFSSVQCAGRWPRQGVLDRGDVCLVAPGRPHARRNEHRRLA